MDSLQQHLARLISHARDWSEQPVSWSRIWLVEDTSVAYGRVSLIPREALATPEEYAARFEAHLEDGHHWINLNAAGILDDALLVVVELPGYRNTGPGNRDLVSVNLSGPRIMDGKPQWDAGSHIQIVG